jgi:hypothetical protein
MRKIDPETGNKERSVDMKTIFETVKVPSFGRPKGPNLLKRSYETGLT